MAWESARRTLAAWLDPRAAITWTILTHIDSGSLELENRAAAKVIALRGRVSAPFALSLSRVHP